MSNDGEIALAGYLLTRLSQLCVEVRPVTVNVVRFQLTVHRACLVCLATLISVS